MTEADWLTDPDFARHLRFLEDRLSPRKLRLLAVAICRATGALFGHPDLAGAAVIVEQYAEGRVDASELGKAQQRCRIVAVDEYEAYARWVGRGTGTFTMARHELAWAVAYSATTPVPLPAVAARVATAYHAATSDEPRSPVLSLGGGLRLVNEELAETFRALAWEVAGNPFRAGLFNAELRTDTVLSLARGIHESGDFHAMPILADALQDAGCDDDGILDHCRQASPTHAHGCWVIDLVLGQA